MYNHKDYIPRTLDVLGIDDHHTIMIWSTANRRLYEIKDFSELNRPRLIHMAGLWAVREIIGRVSKEENPVAVMQDAIAEESRLNQFYCNDSIGQGVWKNPAGDGLLIISGNDAYRFTRSDRMIKWDMVGRPVLGGKLLKLGRPWVSLQSLSTVIGKLSPSLIKSTFEELTTIFSEWTTPHSHDKSLIAGLVGGTNLAGSLDFRPHISVIGQSQSGKSTLCNDTLFHLWPWAERATGRSSEPGIRDSVSMGSLPLLFDEMEAWHGRQSVYELLRGATSDTGTVRKGAGFNRSLRQRVNVMAWTFSLEDGQKEEADNNRYARFTLLRSRPPRLPDKAHLHNLGMLMLAASLVRADEITAATTHLTNELVNTYGRLAQVYSLPVAVQQVFTGMEANAAVDLCAEVLTQKVDALADQSEGEDVELLREILSTIPSKNESPIARLLSDKFDQEEALADVGIRKIEQKRMIFFAHKIIESSLRLSPKWKGKKLNQLLERLPGAVAGSAQRVNGVKQWGTLVPMDVVIPPATEPEDIPF